MMPSPRRLRPAPPRKTVSDQLRALIRMRHLSPYAIGHAAGVSPSILSRFLAGQRGMTTASLDAVCGVLALELRESRRGRGSGQEELVADGLEAELVSPERPVDVAPGPPLPYTLPDRNAAND